MEPVVPLQVIYLTAHLAAPMETTATTEAVRLGSADTNGRSKRDSDNDEGHRQSAGHETLLCTCHARFVTGCLQGGFGRYRLGSAIRIPINAAETKARR